ncbi:MAG: hypothetical protein JXQ74_02865 [Alphaproteobacteria bacterium]|nr:hypothetical protein [Alphaproteobacteria bacterium]
MQQKTNQPQNRRHYSSNQPRSKPISYFIHGAALLAVFLFSAAFLSDILGAVAPQTFSKEVLSFSTPEHLEYHCGDDSPFKGDDFFSDVCDLVRQKLKEQVSIKEIQEKYYPISKSYARHNYIKGILHNGFVILGLILFLRFYRRK